MWQQNLKSSPSLVPDTSGNVLFVVPLSTITLLSILFQLSLSSKYSRSILFSFLLIFSLGFHPSTASPHRCIDYLCSQFFFASPALRSPVHWHSRGSSSRLHSTFLPRSSFQYISIVFQNTHMRRDLRSLVAECPPTATESGHKMVKPSSMGCSQLQWQALDFQYEYLLFASPSIASSAPSARETVSHRPS